MFEEMLSEFADLMGYDDVFDPVLEIAKHDELSITCYELENSDGED